MGRWEPDASGRLRRAAMELYLERGFEETTVADIAERAGLTARTFFRHFADKREVLFSGSALLQQRLVEALAGAPDSASPLDAVGVALDVAAEMLGFDRDFSRQRQAVIDANADLQERELMKLAGLAGALAAQLRARGVPEPQAGLAAETGIAVLRVTFTRWVTESGEASLPDLMRDTLTQLRALTAAG